MTNKCECYELSLAPNYVSDWTFNDAIRELIQNGIDQQAINNRNKFSITYNNGEKKLILKSENSRLKRNSLLLGCSNKANDENTVGQFGEGYKIASLVLTRLNKTFVIYNNEENEIWHCRFKNSEKWHGKILAYYIEKVPTEDRNLEIVIGNVTREEYNNIFNVWIGEEEWITKIHTSYGDILTDEELSGNVYVNELFVYHDEEMKYGFNFKPQYITLERDRKTCSSWDINSITNKMLMEAVVNGDIDIEELDEMVELRTKETWHFQFNKYMPNAEVVAEKFITKFDEINPGCIPVYGQAQINRVNALGGKPIVISSILSEILSEKINDRIKNLAQNVSKEVISPRRKLEIWLASYHNSLSNDARKELQDIIDSMN